MTKKEKDYLNFLKLVDDVKGILERGYERYVARCVENDETIMPYNEWIKPEEE